MSVAGRDRDGRRLRPRAYADRRDSVVSRPIPNLPRGVISPTDEIVELFERASVAAEASAGANGLVATLQTYHLRRHDADVIFGAIAHLAVEIESPAEHGAGVRQRADVQTTHADLRYTAP